MAEFNITNSKIEQINEQGDNVKVSGSNNAVTDGTLIHTSGNANTVTADTPKTGFAEKIGKFFICIWKWIIGWFGFK